MANILKGSESAVNILKSLENKTGAYANLFKPPKEDNNLNKVDQ